MIEQLLLQLESGAKELERLKKEYYEKAKGLSYRLFAGFLAASPDIDKIRLVGYIPYFNDGEECVFGIHVSSYYLNNSSRTDLSDDETPGEISWYWSNMKESNDPEEQRYQLFHRIVNAIPSEVYRDMFGDHFEAFIYSDGRVDINEYEHD